MTADRAPSICQKIAKRVARLLREYNALDHWREMVEAAFAEFMERLGAEQRWSKQRSAHYRAAWERNQKGESEPNEPPAEGWTQEFGHVHLDGVFPIPTLLAWVPPELRDANTPRASLPLPLPDGEQLSLASCYTVLAAIHDASLRGVEHIYPWTAARETVPETFGVWYYGLPIKAKELPTSEAASLLVTLERVEEDIRQLAPAPKSRGRRLLSPRQLAKYRVIKDRWERAKGYRLSKDQFCQDQHISRETLETALRMCRKKTRNR
jgi:hypothetical protein